MASYTWYVIDAVREWLVMSHSFFYGIKEIVIY